MSESQKSGAARPEAVDKVPAVEELRGALQLLGSLLENSQVADIFADDERAATQMVYANGLTLWLLIVQRLGGGKTLDDTVQFLLRHERDLLPNNKRVREGTLSENSSAYARARKRLSLSLIHRVSEAICNHLGALSPPFFDGRRAFILDGTTISLAPTPALRRAFPPATNQHGESAWPIAQLLVVSELQSGCVLLPQIDPMYGEQNASEVAQARRILTQLPPNSLILADAGFGIYSMVHHVRAAGHDVLFRLSRSRFNSIRRQARRQEDAPGFRSYQLTWRPSSKDRRTNPELPAEASVDVWLHEIQLPSGEWLYLVTSLHLDASSAAELYRRRYDVEFDIRDLKVTMDAENLRARSVEMALKELYTSVVAYNLVAQFRRQAAQVAKVPPRRLRFTSIWTCFQYRLLTTPARTLEEWLQEYEAALRSAAQKKHPRRSKPRSYPRAAYPRWPKTTRSQKEKRVKKTTKTADEARK